MAPASLQIYDCNHSKLRLRAGERKAFCEGCSEWITGEEFEEALKKLYAMERSRRVKAEKDVRRLKDIIVRLTERDLKGEIDGFDD